MHRLNTAVKMAVLSLMILAPGTALATWDYFGGSLNNNTSNDAYNPDIVVPAGNSTMPIATFQEMFAANTGITVRRWSTALNDWVNMGTTAININPNQRAVNPRIALDPNTDIPYVCWQENSSDGYQIHLAKWNGTDWENTTTGYYNKVSINAAGNPDLVFNYQTTARGYMTWTEVNGSYDRVWAVRFDSADLTAYDTDCLPNGYLNNSSATSAYDPCIAIGPNNQPVVTWQEGTVVMDTYVRKWNGSDWEMLGTRVGNLATSDKNPAVAVNSNNRIYVAYNEVATSTNLIVKYWNSSTWVVHGNIVDSDSNLGPMHLYVNDADVLYVAYQKGATSNIYVKFFNGTDWESLGGSMNRNASMAASSPRLAVSAAGVFGVWSEMNDSTFKDNIYMSLWDTPPTATPTATMTVTETGTPGTGATATPSPTPGTPTPEPESLIEVDQTMAYPMPATTQLNFAFRITDGSGDPVVRVYNTHFRLVAEIQGATTANGSGTIPWNCSDIAPGVYFYQVAIGDKKTKAAKFIIAR